MDSHVGFEAEEAGRLFQPNRLPSLKDSIPENPTVPLSPLSRRTFLRSAGVCIGLPLLDAMLPIGLGADRKAAALRNACS